MRVPSPPLCILTRLSPAPSVLSFCHSNLTTDGCRVRTMSINATYSIHERVDANSAGCDCFSPMSSGRWVPTRQFSAPQAGERSKARRQRNLAAPWVDVLRMAASQTTLGSFQEHLFRTRSVQCTRRAGISTARKCELRNSGGRLRLWLSCGLAASNPLR